ncbi:tetratricopeptide repeat protein [Chloroflexi bacterium TSY]|nr:tetratricopeptide repeat protein [Chloroflexi bacterium TSY]
MGKIEDAAATLQHAHHLDSTVPWALLELAQLHQSDRTYAESFLKSAHEIAPEQAYVDIVSAQLCAVWEAFDCAVDAYQRAEEKRPNSGWLYGRIGDLDGQKAESFDHQDWSKAAEYYEKAVERRPNDPWAHERLAFAYFNQGNYVESVEHFGISLNELSHPQSQLAARYCNLAQAQQIAEMLDEALATYQVCLNRLSRSKFQVLRENSG